MKILGIETSCDETAVAVVADGRIILKSEISTSLALHKKYGGIVPEIAARKQAEILPYLLSQTLAKYSINTLDAIAITVGPGLVGSLLIGTETAKVMAYVSGLPLIPVNHLVGHLYSAWLIGEGEKKRKVPQFPILGCVISGGHTDLVLMRDHGKIEYLGGTRDDAAGEAFDKIARMLGLPYPGGPEIEKLASNFKNKYLKGNDIKFPEIPLRLPRPMISSNNFEFSFSGLKTAVYYLLNSSNKKGFNQKTKGELMRGRLAYETQNAVCEVVGKKIEMGVKKYFPKSVILAGGVAANKCLRKQIYQLCKENNINYYPAPIRLCTDNATYIAAAAFFNFKKQSWQKTTIYPNMEITD